MYKSLLSRISHFIFPVRLKGENNVVEHNGRISRDLTIRVHGNNNRIVIGDRLGVRGKAAITIIGDNNTIVLKDNFRIHAGYLLIAGSNSVIYVDDDCAFRHPEFICMEDGVKITVGKNCLLAHHVLLRTSDAHSIIDKETGKRFNHARDITLGNHVWLADNVTILKGVHIGDNSVVGTRALVTKDVPANSIAAGIPARVVKQGVNWSNKLL